MVVPSFMIITFYYGDSEKKHTIFFNYLNNRKKDILLQSLKNKADQIMHFWG